MEHGNKRETRGQHYEPYEFLKQTDSLTAKYTAEQLASFIHDTARVLPEKHRVDFLKRLKEAGAVEQDVQEKKDRCSASTIDSAYEAIRKNFETIVNR